VEYLWILPNYLTQGLQNMGNIHTVGPNEALIVSGKWIEQLRCIVYLVRWLMMKKCSF
jgi:hypothetical protein